MNKQLVCYFSASGRTRKVATWISEALGADLMEIVPEKPYTKADLNWVNPFSRSSKEMHKLDYRPAIEKTELDVDAYERVFVGFPIWWYIAPTVVNTFLETFDFKGKEIVLFATSGSSGFGKTLEKLQGSTAAALKEGIVFSGLLKEEKVKEWASHE